MLYKSCKFINNLLNESCDFTQVPQNYLDWKVVGIKFCKYPG